MTHDPSHRSDGRGAKIDLTIKAAIRNKISSRNLAACSLHFLLHVVTDDPAYMYRVSNEIAIIAFLQFDVIDFCYAARGATHHRVVQRHSSISAAS